MRAGKDLGFLSGVGSQQKLRQGADPFPTYLADRWRDQGQYEDYLEGKVTYKRRVESDPGPSMGTARMAVPFTGWGWGWV